MDSIVSNYHEVSTQEGLEEAALPTAHVSKHVTAEDIALGLFLLQVNLLSSGHCRGPEHKYRHQRIGSGMQLVTTLLFNCCFNSLKPHLKVNLTVSCEQKIVIIDFPKSYTYVYARVDTLQKIYNFIVLYPNNLTTQIDF